MSALLRTGFLAAGLSALAGAAWAQLPMIVYGSGYARNCYEEVKQGHVSIAAALRICDVALQEEQLSERNRAATFSNRGILYMREGNHERAMKDYQAALRILPDLAETKINLGAMYFYLGRFNESVAALDEGVKVKDVETRAAAYYNRALSHERLGDVERAYADYRMAVSLTPDFDEAARQLERFSVVPASAF